MATSQVAVLRTDPTRVLEDDARPCGLAGARTHLDAGSTTTTGAMKNAFGARGRPFQTYEKEGHLDR